MRKTILFLATLVMLSAHSQESEKETFKNLVSMFAPTDTIVLQDSGVKRDNNTYMDVYRVFSDSAVVEFEMQYWYCDSTFLRGCISRKWSRREYDFIRRMSREAKRDLEKDRKETIEFLNRERASKQVWTLFKLYELLDSKGYVGVYWNILGTCAYVQEKILENSFSYFDDFSSILIWN